MTKNKLLLLLVLLMTAATGAWGMQIYISYPSWPTGTNVNGDGNLVLEMEPSDSFEQMKARIGDKSGLNPDYMKLYFNSVEMANNETLNAKGVTSNSVLTLVYTLYTVSLKDGVKDADKWTVKVGEGEAQALPIGGLKGDGSETVTLQYNGRLKVKGVKATSDAAPAEEPVPMEFVEFTNGTKKVKFANMNLGATSVADGTSSYGDYYAWAATEPFGTVSYTAYNAGTVTATKEGGYSAANAPYRSGNAYSKYTSHGAILEAMDDAATVKMGEGYRMPTMDDFSTLCAACGGTDAEIYISSIATGAAYAKGIYWVAGAETAVTVGGDEYKTNGVLFVQDADHHVFFPYAGRINGDNEFEYDGYYWSSTLITDTYSHDYLDAHYMYLCQYYVGHGDQYLTDRQLGFPIRPVQEVPAEATPALSITSPSVGQVIGSDGKNYAYGSLPTGVTAVAKICYVSGSNGLAMALTDEGKMDWSTAIETCAAHTAPFTGGTWKLATKDEWDNMISAAGSFDALRDGFSSVGGTNMKSDDWYWSSTENGSDFAWYYDDYDQQDWDSGDKEYELYVRACLAFTVEQAAPAANIVDLSTLTADYEAQNGDVLTRALGNKVKISIADRATVTLDNATINGKSDDIGSYSWAGLNCLGNATIVLKDGTTNTVRGFYANYPGIHVPAGSKLTIKGGTEGTGKLTASPFDGGTDDNSYGAGIGGGYQIACGDISIEGGVITANGGCYAAGIGGGTDGSCGNITITGGDITATGGQQAAGIGSGYEHTCGNITIASTVKKVTATAGEYAPHSIGKGTDGSCGTVTIGGTVYWQDNAAVNGGDTYLATSPLIYDPSN